MQSPHSFVRPCCAVLSLCVLLASTSGCSFLVDGTEAVNISVTQSDAQIYVDNQLVGTGTARVELEKDDSHLVVAKIGDRSAQKTIKKGISVTGILDIVGGLFFLVPFVGIAAPGFWKLEPTQINLSVPDAGPASEQPRSFGD